MYYNIPFYRTDCRAVVLTIKDRAMETWRKIERLYHYIPQYLED